MKFFEKKKYPSATDHAVNQTTASISLIEKKWNTPTDTNIHTYFHIRCSFDDFLPKCESYFRLFSRHKKMAYQKVSLLYSHTIHIWLFPFAAPRFVPTKLKRSAFSALFLFPSFTLFPHSSWVCVRRKKIHRNTYRRPEQQWNCSTAKPEQKQIFEEKKTITIKNLKGRKREREREVRQSIRKTIMEYKVKHCINEHLGLCQFFNFFFLSSVALCFDSVYSFGLLPSSVDSHCSHFIYASVWYAQQPVKIEWISND